MRASFFDGAAGSGAGLARCAGLGVFARGGPALAAGLAALTGVGPGVTAGQLSSTLMTAPDAPDTEREARRPS